MSYVLGNSVVGQVTNSGVVSYLLTDGHGTTRALVNSSGQVGAHMDYDAYDNAIDFNPSTIGTIWLTSDGMFDSTSGLYFHGSGRESSGVTGTFIEMDSPFAPGDLANANLYLYVGGSPTNGWDPSGHDGTEGEAVTTTGIGAGLIARLGLAVARLYIQAGITILKIVEFAPAIYGGLAIGGLALEALKSVAQNLQNADLKIPLNAANDKRGNAIEDAALTGEEDDGALDHYYPKIDYFKDGFGLSIRSHAVGSKDALVGAIRSDLKNISNIENETLTGKMRDGTRLTIAPGDITTKGLLVAVPRDDASVVYEEGFLEEVQSLADEFDTAVKVVSVEGWE